MRDNHGPGVHVRATGSVLLAENEIHRNGGDGVWRRDSVLARLMFHSYSDTLNHGTPLQVCS